jgi:hypothetical protein
MNNAQILGAIFLVLASTIGLADTCMWLVRRDRQRT